MLAKIIACLDVKDGMVVKGTQFRNHEEMGDALTLAKRYSDEGADELVIYDITASSKGVVVDKSWVKTVKEVISIPLCVAGGIKTIEDAQALFDNGVDKVSINSPALANPHFINELVATFGSDKVVVGIDSYYDAALDDYFVYTLTGDVNTTSKTAWKTLDWVKEVQSRGAGEIVLNMMNQDGVRDGYDLAQLKKVRDICTVSLVASGGAGKMAHFKDAYLDAKVDGTLGASAFHKKIVNIGELKAYLQDAGIDVIMNKEPQTMKQMQDPNAIIEMIDWKKVANLMPVIVQDYVTSEVLMLGYMNQEALTKTLETTKVTFFSRTKERLWMKGEESGNVLNVVDYALDCDNDTLLILARPVGPTCHLGDTSCFESVSKKAPWVFFSRLEKLLESRKNDDPQTSYTASLYASGSKRIAQKVGEEGVEVALAATVHDKDEVICEMADLLYHATVLLHDQDLAWEDVLNKLNERHSK
ncbi:MAG TPA: imidazole glycerol phosphate synthase subunit HisF [Candidatus Ignatzschineria merdigallinarum]|uniref:Histidine biosynthesis bifunctional protein HisIE n=1 Tax=Candidatus Ignatzschineria merdigallinarum TaxID=2838621 RepID=A0A9D1Q690_9GAMM|nr:imidazole glycerol phosphate synthase subunit HisF [Candidatus Ignatzschineria merdigallinarum]